MGHEPPIWLMSPRFVQLTGNTRSAVEVVSNDYIAISVVQRKVIFN